MPVDLSWDNDQKTVIRISAEGVWNWNDFHKTLRSARYWLDSVQPPVELMIDLRRSAYLPAGALGHVRSLGVKIHPHGRDRVVIIGLDSAVAAALGGAEGVYSDGRRLIRFVGTEDAARAVLAAWQSEST